MSFIFGGLICAVGEFLILKTALTPARILVGYVCTGVVLGAAGVYGAFTDLAHSGATVPLTGFGYLLAKGVYRAVTEEGLSGVLTGGLKAASGGISAAVIFGFLAGLFGFGYPQGSGKKSQFAIYKR